MKKIVISMLGVIVIAVITATLILNNITEVGVFKREFEKQDADVIITEQGTLFFLTDNGQVYGFGEGSDLGFNEHEYKEKAVRIPIKDKINKISTNDRTVFFFGEDGRIYQTGEPKKYFDYIFPEDLGYEPKQINLSEIGERITDVVEFTSGKGCYFISESGKVFVLDDERKYEEIIFPEKIVSAYTTDFAGWFLSESKKLYVVGGIIPESAVSEPDVKAENVAEVFVLNGKEILYKSEDGKVYGIGRKNRYLDFNYISVNIKPDGSPYKEDSNGEIWVVDFVEINTIEKTEYILPFKGSHVGVGLLGESGRLWLLGQDYPRSLIGDSYRYNTGTLSIGLLIKDVEEIEKIKTSWKKAGINDVDGIGRYAYAVKRTNEPWKVCLSMDYGGFLAGEEVPIYELPEWK